MKNETTQIAYICPGCDDFRTVDVNIFDFSGTRKKVYTCDCEKSEITVTKNSTKSFKVEMYCPVCKENHSYMVPFNQFFSDDVFTFSCPYFEAEVLFIGSGDKLSEKLNEYLGNSSEYVEEIRIADNETIDKMVTLSKIVYEQPERINICSCSDTYSVAYNEKGIYIICDKCNQALPVAFDRVETILNDILNN